MTVLSCEGSCLSSDGPTGQVPRNTTVSDPCFCSLYRVTGTEEPGCPCGVGMRQLGEADVSQAGVGTTRKQRAQCLKIWLEAQIDGAVTCFMGFTNKTGNYYLRRPVSHDAESANMVEA